MISAGGVYTKLLPRAMAVTQLVQIIPGSVWFGGLPGASVAKNLPVGQETQVRSLGWEDSLE